MYCHFLLQDIFRLYIPNFLLYYASKYKVVNLLHLDQSIRMIEGMWHPVKIKFTNNDFLV